MALTPERRVRAIAVLEQFYRKWSDVKAQMVGWLYPRVIEDRYLDPVRRKLAELRRRDGI